MIYYIIPVFVITINDICAYYVGFFFGKTPLIKLSPKKTMEGYIGGGFLTLILGVLFTAFCLNFHCLLCPATFNTEYIPRFVLDPHETLFSQSLFIYDRCDLDPVFVPMQYQFGLFEIEMPPFLWHGLNISVFAALIGPFAGFLASGFKRACNKKVGFFLQSRSSFHNLFFL